MVCLSAATTARVNSEVLRFFQSRLRATRTARRRSTLSAPSERERERREAYTKLLALNDFDLLSLHPRGRQSASASAGGAKPAGHDDDDDDDAADEAALEEMLADSYPAAPAAAPAAKAETPTVLTEFIDARGLHEATIQLEALVADAETTGTLRVRLIASVVGFAV